MNPYKNQPTKSFWKQAVASVSTFGLTDLYKKKFTILPKDKISTAGSCFAQHIGKAMSKSGFNYQDFEPAPNFLDAETSRKFGFGVYSARYGNIYSVQQLEQLFDRAFGTFEPVENCWENDGRYYDPFRPNVEPNGFVSEEECLAMQAGHLKRVRQMFEQTNVFVFTLGLTEAWRNKADGSVYPTCPGTLAGTFDPNKYEFVNFGFVEIMQSLESVIAKLRAINPDIKVLLTVSPVPLTATATDDHVLLASTYSKSVLRAVAGEMANRHDFIDYFPSFEIISSHPTRGMFFEPNLRSISPHGVDYVMSHFFKEHKRPRRKPKQAKVEEKDIHEIVCEEELMVERV